MTCLAPNVRMHLIDWIGAFLVLRSHIVYFTLFFFFFFFSFFFSHLPFLFLFMNTPRVVLLEF
jgi:hypothetical protein